MGLRVMLPTPGPILKTTGVLSLKEANILANIYMAVTLDSKEGAIKAMEVIEKFLTCLGRRDLFELKMALLSFEQGGLLGPFRFSSLNEAEKVRTLEKWQKVEGLRGIIYSALREISYLAFYSMKENWKAIGYSGPMVSLGDNDPQFNEMYEELLAKR